MLRAESFPQSRGELFDFQRLDVNGLVAQKIQKWLVERAVTSSPSPINHQVSQSQLTLQKSPKYFFTGFFHAGRARVGKVDSEAVPRDHSSSVCNLLAKLTEFCQKLARTTDVEIKTGTAQTTVSNVSSGLSVPVFIHEADGGQEEACW